QAHFHKHVQATYPLCYGRLSYKNSRLFLFICRFTKPQTFADCRGNELPLGWEEAYDKQIGPYYINHMTRKYSQILFLTIIIPR
ncbi:hypothetical protein HHI36_010838, partial [Cryptolaemus montrouzieri]